MIDYYSNFLEYCSDSPLIDHRREPIKMGEQLGLLYKLEIED